MKTVVSAAVLAAASLGSAHADVLDLSALVGGANVYSLTTFSAPSADVEGSIVAAGNITLSSYSVNLNNKDAYGSYALISGGSLTLTGGSILNGDTYVAGTSSITSATTATAVQSGTSPVNFSAVSSSLTQTSTALSQLTTTATAVQKWGGIYITGSGSSVEVIDLDASWLSSASYYTITGVATGATLIVNITGSSATLQGGYQAFDGYNVLFNFVDATSLTISTGANISILATSATVSGGSGVIDGTVVVKSWDSQVQINSGNGFDSVSVAGLVLNTSGADAAASVVPEPATYAMLLAGLGLIGFTAMRRRQQAR